MQVEDHAKVDPVRIGKGYLETGTDDELDPARVADVEVVFEVAKASCGGDGEDDFIGGVAHGLDSKESGKSTCASTLMDA